ncbi:MAG: hypothetical protein MHMPM18_002570 [Marteilia pararefringens]
MMVLVGNKIDMREANNRLHATTDDVKQLSKTLTKVMRKNQAMILSNKVYWYETSCIADPAGVTRILQEVVATYMTGGKKAKSGCSTH